MADPLSIIAKNTLYRCDTCNEEDNCHPADEMFVADSNLICDECRSGEDLPRVSSFMTPLQPAPSVREYCTCNSKTNPCIVCGKSKFIDPEWLKRKLETDPDEGEIGRWFRAICFPCTRRGRGVVGGGSKLFRLAINRYSPGRRACHPRHFGWTYRRSLDADR